MPLPTEKSKPMPRVGKVFLYAEPKIGKSTLSMMLDPEHTIGLDVEDGLNAIEGYKAPIKSWGKIAGVEGEGRNQRAIMADDSFRGVIRDLHQTEHAFTYAVVDTADALAKLCNDYVLQALGGAEGAQRGFVHASDFEYGKGWSAINEEWALRIGALCMVVPNVILISHADRTTKTDRTGAEFPVFTPALGPKGIRNWTLGFVEHILFLNVERNDDGEDLRVVHSRPSRSWEAGGRVPIGVEPVPDPLWLPTAETAGAELRAALERVSGGLSTQNGQATETTGEAAAGPQTAKKPAQRRGSRPKAKDAEPAQGALGVGEAQAS